MMDVLKLSNLIEHIEFHQSVEQLNKQLGYKSAYKQVLNNNNDNDDEE